MGHQIVQIRVNGARGKVLVQEHMPVYYPNLYVTLEQSGRALNTQHVGADAELTQWPMPR